MDRIEYTEAFICNRDRRRMDIGIARSLRSVVPGRFSGKQT
jgi:hypothetical protein